MSWSAVARLAKLIRPEIIDDSEKRLAKSPGEVKKRATSLLDEMAATKPTGAGVRTARDKLAGALPSFVDPKSVVGGEDPNVGLVKQCALVLFHGMLARAGAAVRSGPDAETDAVALIEAARSIDFYRDGLKSALSGELMESLGPDLFDRATKKLEARTKP